MEMVERYVYAVAKKLPEAQRKDVARELHGLIEDMLDERVQDRDVTEADVKEVLIELGHPGRLAQQYRGGKKYIIGPELYDLYILVLKIAFISVISAFTVIFAIEVIVDPVNIIDYFVDYIVSFFTTIIPNVIGWTTLGFALAEYYSEGQLQKMNTGKEWDPSKLTPIPDSKQQIKQSEPIISIVASLLIIAALVYSDYVGIWVFKNGEITSVIPFTSENAFIPFVIIILFGLVIVKECLKLFYGRWTKSLVVFTTVANVISIVIIMFLVTGDNFWNPAFMSDLVQHDIVTEGTDGYQVVQSIWENATLWILILLPIGLIWELIAGIIKVRKTKY